MASWRTSWSSFVTCVIVLRTLSLSACGDTLGPSSNSNPELPSKPHCPGQAVFAPCYCYSNPFGVPFDVDCSGVTSEDELRRVFSNNFSFPDFGKFTIKDNPNIHSLREGDLGSASFTYINIQHTPLSEIEANALDGSLDTLETFDLRHTSLKLVPDISAFTNLKNLLVLHGQIDQFPNVSSDSLEEIDLEGNYIDDVPEDAIWALPSLEIFAVNNNSLREIHPQTLTRNERLVNIDLSFNRLTTIPDDAISLHGEDTWLGLDGNQITSLTHKSISSVTGILWIDYNNFTELPEKTFRPLLEESVTVIIHDNPFKCGCDLAWLVLNQTLLNRLYHVDDVKCADGKSFSDLDPSVYAAMCPNATVVPL